MLSQLCTVIDTQQLYKVMHAEGIILETAKRLDQSFLAANCQQKTCFPRNHNNFILQESPIRN